MHREFEDEVARLNAAGRDFEDGDTAPIPESVHLERDLEARDEKSLALSTLHAKFTAELGERNDESSAAKSMMTAMERERVQTQTQLKAVRLWSIDEHHNENDAGGCE